MTFGGRMPEPDARKPGRRQEYEVPDSTMHGACLSRGCASPGRLKLLGNLWPLGGGRQAPSDDRQGASGARIRLLGS